jgi:DNA-binding MarR family transcriptional regulator
VEDEELVRLRVALARISRALDRQTRGDQLTRTQLSVLATVARRGPIRISEVAEVEGVNPTMLSRIVAKLEAAGLLGRTADPSDGRAAHVEITPAGAELHARLRDERTELLAGRLGALPAGQADRLREALPALEALAESLVRS